MHGSVRLSSSLESDRTTTATAGGRWWRAVAAGPVIAAVTLALALVATHDAGVPLRDPDGVASMRLVVAGALVAVLVGLDMAVRRDGRWTRQRGLAVSIALVGFFASYLGYRNLKSVVPLLRPDVLFDGRLSDVDRAVFAGHEPAAVLHDLLGTGVAAQALSAVYMLFFMFIPVSLALALVFSRDIHAGLFFTTALTLNWLLGAGSYFLLPSIGPFHADPATFAALPPTPVSHLQELLVDQRAGFLRYPAAPGAAQSIGAFASLHVSIYATAAIATHLLRLPRKVRALAWTLTALTALSTIYFGWHFLADDVAGLVIAAMALGLSCVLTGFDPRVAARRRRTAEAVPAAAATPAAAAKEPA